MNIQHSSRTDCWYTPLEIILMIKEVLGDITLDPASDDHGNARIGAKYFITREQDGLSTEWIPGTIYLNPPGSKISNKSIACLFWQKLMNHLEKGKLTHAIFMGFSIEQLAVSQIYSRKSMLDFPICIPSKRIHFDSSNSIKNSPSHSNVVIYIPGSIDKTDDFINIFSKLGKCKR